MQHWKGFILSSGGESIAFIAAIAFIKKISWPYKIIAWQAIVGFVVEVTGFYYRIHYSNNIWLYNCYLLADWGLLLLAGFKIIQLNSKYMLFAPGFCLFIALWLWNLRANGINAFASEAMVVNSMMQLGLYLLVLYQTTMNNQRSLATSPAFWICVGIVLYYGCCIPFFSIHDYLSVKKNETIAIKLNGILMILNNLRYLLYTWSFYLFYKENRSKK